MEVTINYNVHWIDEEEMLDFAAIAQTSRASDGSDSLIFCVSAIWARTFASLPMRRMASICGQGRSAISAACWWKATSESAIR